MIYQPSDDSYLLEKEVKKLSKNKSVLDLGSGSGIQALGAIQSRAKLVLASDISPEAVKHLKSQNIPSIQSNLFSKIKGKFDLIIFNPPYLPLDKREPKDSRLATTGGKNGDEITLRFLKQCPKHMNKEGIILILLSSLTPKGKILKLLSKLDLEYKILSSLKMQFESLEVWKITTKSDKNN